MNINKTNPDLEKERVSATLNLSQLKAFLGENLFGTREKHSQMMKFRSEMVSQIKPLFEENFYNLSRKEKYETLYKKTLEIYTFITEKNAWDEVREIWKLPVIGAVLGAEKVLFSLDIAAFKVSIELWGTEEQRDYWLSLMNQHPNLVGTYIQTELGHGTYVRGLETTATFDRERQEFILHSPTLTSIKFWPGTGGITANFGLVMAKLIIDGVDHGVHAFVVQLRSLIDHKLEPGIETGDIGPKIGFESHDNGYIKFNHARVPLFNMLMKNAVVSKGGVFTRVGSELVMYACMLILRASLCLYAALLLSISSTIAVRYSSVRRQTVATNGIELQIIDYQTQQYRLFTGLAYTYAHFFGANHLIRTLIEFRVQTNNFNDMNLADLGKLHAVSAGLKAVAFNNCLKFAQMNRLCCGGHGYSASSGLGQIVQEADGGCTYEGDNVVLLLQTARFLFKCAQKEFPPHLEVIEDFEQNKILARFKPYFKILVTLYDILIGEVSALMVSLAKENGRSESEAWNECSVQLVYVAKCYISIYLSSCNLKAILVNGDERNQETLSELFELFVLYDLTDTYATSLLKFGVVSSAEMSEYTNKLFHLLPKIRVNAVALVDAFDLLDSNLGSTLGAYDGNVYERLFEFARNSKLNEKDVHDAYDKYMRPFVAKQKAKARL